MKISKKERRKRRHKKIREKIRRLSKYPRLSVFRSNKHIWCQLIDNKTNKVIESASDKEINQKNLKNKTKTEKAFMVGELIAKKILAKNIKKVSFDRSGYKYHGRVKALAEGARKGGLIF